jgi:hypothetical protein
MGNRDRVRGYLDFVVPKSAKGLKLVYSHLPRSDSVQPQGSRGGLGRDAMLRRGVRGPERFARRCQG